MTGNEQAMAAKDATVEACAQAIVDVRVHDQSATSWAKAVIATLRKRGWRAPGETVIDPAAFVKAFWGPSLAGSQPPLEPDVERALKACGAVVPEPGAMSIEGLSPDHVAALAKVASLTACAEKAERERDELRSNYEVVLASAAEQKVMIEEAHAEAHRGKATLARIARERDEARAELALLRETLTEERRRDLAVVASRAHTPSLPEKYHHDDCWLRVVDALTRELPRTVVVTSDALRDAARTIVEQSIEVGDGNEEVPGPLMRDLEAALGVSATPKTYTDPIVSVEAKVSLGYVVTKDGEEPAIESCIWADRDNALRGVRRNDGERLRVFHVTAIPEATPVTAKVTFEVDK